MRCDALQGHHHVGSFLAAFPFVNSNLFRPISVFCGLCRYAVATQAFPVPQQPFNLPQGGKICSRLCFREGQIYFFILPQGGSLRRNDEARRAGLSVRPLGLHIPRWIGRKDKATTCPFLATLQRVVASFAFQGDGEPHHNHYKHPNHHRHPHHPIPPIHTHELRIAEESGCMKPSKK